MFRLYTRLRTHDIHCVQADPDVIYNHVCRSVTFIIQSVIVGAVRLPQPTFQQHHVSMVTTLSANDYVFTSR